MVQEGGLFPHLTVGENIALIMKSSHIPAEKIRERVWELLELVNLEPEIYRNKYPAQLSGGQRQRVGVARAFAMDPGIILMDEPFSALDPLTRSELQDEVVRLQKKYKKTVVFVTHDMDEAIKIATRICFLYNGRVIQCDTPENILKNPSNDYIRNFIGENRLWLNPEFIQGKRYNEETSIHNFEGTDDSSGNADYETEQYRQFIGNRGKEPVPGDDLDGFPQERNGLR